MKGPCTYAHSCDKVVAQRILFRDGIFDELYLDPEPMPVADACWYYNMKLDIAESWASQFEEPCQTKINTYSHEEAVRINHEKTLNSYFSVRREENRKKGPAPEWLVEKRNRNADKHDEGVIRRAKKAQAKRALEKKNRPKREVSAAVVKKRRDDAKDQAEVQRYIMGARTEYKARGMEALREVAGFLPNCVKNTMKHPDSDDAKLEWLCRMLNVSTVQKFGGLLNTADDDEDDVPQWILERLCALLAEARERLKERSRLRREKHRKKEMRRM